MSPERETVAPRDADAGDTAWRGALEAEGSGPHPTRNAGAEDGEKRTKRRPRNHGKRTSRTRADQPPVDGPSDREWDDEARDDRPGDDAARDGRTRDDRTRGDRARGKRKARGRDDRGRDDRARDDRARDDREWDDAARDVRTRGDRARGNRKARGRDDRERGGRSGDVRSRGGRAGSAGAGSGAAGAGPRGTRTLLARWGLVGWGAVLAAVVFLGWSGWTVWRDDPAASGPAGPTGDRAVVLRAAERHIAALNSMDGANVDAGLRAWLGATTGALHAQLQRDDAANRRKIGASGTDAEATVTGAAVTSLDGAAGKAKVIAAVRVRLTLRGGEPTMQRKRFAAELARTPQGWKLESLTAVPVGAR
ncbi:hypothetical protein [Actinomadura algeriensis]|uniref:Mce-associated membrane protein n=1 Tax=Actinomadura algeriensis TaxID=1679523 RepID=A0ABR9JMK8_9ACTN|nr:hypothetical protein [Actinomadura algeriensis]MBE1531785.1 hypothetical protein [Actinomadura algeriensis]